MSWLMEWTWLECCFFFGDVFVTFVKSTFCFNMVLIRFFWLYDLNVGDDVIDVHVMSLVCGPACAWRFSFTLQEVGEVKGESWLTRPLLLIKTRETRSVCGRSILAPWLQSDELRWGLKLEQAAHDINWNEHLYSDIRIYIWFYNGIGVPVESEDYEASLIMLPFGICNI